MYIEPNIFKQVKHVLRAVNHIAIIKKKYFQKELEEEKSKNVKYIIGQEKSKQTYSKTKKFKYEHIFNTLCCKINGDNKYCLQITRRTCE